MNIVFNGNEEDISMILVTAERYAIGRRTYIVEWVCEVINKNLNLLSEKDKNVVIRDIKEAYSYGDECDKIVWLDLLHKLESNKKV